MEAIKKIEEELKGKAINLSSLKKERTAIIIIDMVNEFSSQRFYEFVFIIQYAY